MKKIMIALLSVLLLTALLIPAAAEGTPVFTVTPSKTSTYPGDTVEITVSVSQGKYNSFGFHFNYSESAFEFVKAVSTVQGATMNDFDENKKVLTVAFQGETEFSGNILKVTLKVKPDADQKEYSFGGSGTFTNQSQTSATAGTVKTGSVTVGCQHQFTKWEKVDDQTHRRTCSKCQKVEKSGHVYDNDCDPTCNGCGAKRDVKHQWQVKWTYDKSGHWHECAVCDEKTKVEPHKRGPEATENNPQTCTVCGYEISPKLDHKHTYREEWSANGEGHWHVCSKWGCYAQVDYEEHVYDNACDSVCNVCGEPRKAPHVPNEEWRGDETGHYHVCTRCGGQVNLLPHDPGPEATQDTPQVCLTCGYIIKPVSGNHTHNFEGDWQSDDYEHWHQCTCGEKADLGAHEWDEGVVTKAPTKDADGEKTFTCQVCGKAKTEIVPVQDDTVAPDAPDASVQSSSDAGNKGGNNSLWGIVAIVAVVLAVIGIGILVWLMLPMNKNRHGKFSS